MIAYEELLQMANEARTHAYAPYSCFAVGAALLTEGDRVYTGCNVENAAYGDTICAERTAFLKAVSEGERHFTAIAVVGGPAGAEAQAVCTPCGSCRQMMAEFCADDFMIITSEFCISLGELLPHAFRLTPSDQ